MWVAETGEHVVGECEAVGQIIEEWKQQYKITVPRRGDELLSYLRNCGPGEPDRRRAPACFSLMRRLVRALVAKRRKTEEK